MNNSKLNKLLITEFANLLDKYHKEVDWQEGDETGSHVVYEDVFVPYIKECIESNMQDELIKIFKYIEFLLDYNDLNIEEVVAFSVFEYIMSLIFDKEDVLNLMGVKSRKLFQEVFDADAKRRIRSDIVNLKKVIKEENLNSKDLEIAQYFLNDSKNKLEGIITKEEI